MTEHEWSPPWAKHVKGTYTPRKVTPQGELEEPAVVSAKCSVCGAEYGPRKCDTGLVRNHIANFALAHAHRDHFNPKGKP